MRKYGGALPRSTIFICGKVSLRNRQAAAKFAKSSLPLLRLNLVEHMNNEDNKEVGEDGEINAAAFCRIQRAALTPRCFSAFVGSSDFKTNDCRFGSK